MIRESLSRLALRAYPRELARSRGAEMQSTVLDMSGPSRLAFVRELGFLVFCGLRERSRMTARSGRRQLTTDACSGALILFLAVPLWGMLSRFGTSTMRDGKWSLIVLGVCLVFVLAARGLQPVGRDRGPVRPRDRRDHHGVAGPADVG